MCLCNPSSPLMGFSFLHFLLVYYLSLSSAHQLVKSLLTSSVSRVNSRERLPGGIRHGFGTVYCTFCNQSCFILYIQIDIYAHDVIWFYKWMGEELMCLLTKRLRWDPEANWNHVSFISKGFLDSCRFRSSLIISGWSSPADAWT